MQFGRLLAGLPGLRQGLLVVAETVGEDCRYPLAELDHQALPGSSRVLRHGLDQPRGLGFRAPQASDQYGRERREAGSCRLRDRITLRDQRRSRRKLAAPRRNCPQRVNIEHKPA
jgi:hypothetical protein